MKRRQATARLRAGHAFLRRINHQLLLEALCASPGLLRPALAKELGLSWRQTAAYLGDFRSGDVTLRAEVELSIERRKGYRPRVVRLLRFLYD